MSDENNRGLHSPLRRKLIAGSPAFLRRLILAGTLSSSYGIYGPPFELMEHVARKGAEEYVDNEKFQLRVWDLDDPNSLRFEIQRLNEIRRDNPALHTNASNEALPRF